MMYRRRGNGIVWMALALGLGVSIVDRFYGWGPAMIPPTFIENRGHILA